MKLIYVIDLCLEYKNTEVEMNRMTRNTPAKTTLSGQQTLYCVFAYVLDVSPTQYYDDSPAFNSQLKLLLHSPPFTQC